MGRGREFRVGGIDHVELFVPERREAAGWYRDVLGFDVLAGCEAWAADPGGPLMISPDGGRTKLALFRGNPRGDRETAGFHRVAFVVDGESFLRFLELTDELGLVDDAGRPVTRDAAIDHDQAFSVYFCDPYGHRLEITTYDPTAVRRLSG